MNLFNLDQFCFTYLFYKASFNFIKFELGVNENKTVLKYKVIVFNV